MARNVIQKAKLPDRAAAVCAFVLRMLILITIMIFASLRIIRKLLIIMKIIRKLLIITKMIIITIVVTRGTTQAGVTIAVNYLLNS